MRGAVRTHMLPDSHELRQQPCDRTPCDPLKPTASNGSSQKRSFCKPAKKQSAPPSSYVQETLNAFLALWPHRYDYLYAPHPDPGTKPEWQTESRHPLADRLITQGALLLGVRPGPQTTYALLDIDRGSPYHPKRDPLALQRICDGSRTPRHRRPCRPH